MYCYGFFKEYISAKRKKDIEKCTEMEHQCYNQYINLAHKMKWDLIKRLQKTSATQDTILELTSNYESDIYPELIKAMNGVKLNKIPNKKNKKGEYTWNFYAAYWGYLMTFNRDVVSHYIKRNQKESLTDFQITKEEDSNDFITASKASINNEMIYEQSPDKIYEKKLDKKAFWNTVDICLSKKFTPIQKRIWKLKNKPNKISVKDICTKLNISPCVYNKNLKEMKESFNTELKKQTDIVR